MIKKFFSKPITVVCFIFYLLTTFYIFYSSLQNASESSKHSSSVWSFLSKALNVFGDYEGLIRKLIGHFLLFSTLAIFASVVYHRIAKLVKTNNVFVFSLCLTLTVGLITATISELLQLFADGRSAQVSDVFLDFCGFVLGYILYLLAKRIALYIIYRKNARKN